MEEFEPQEGVFRNAKGLEFWNQLDAQCLHRVIEGIVFDRLLRCLLCSMLSQILEHDEFERLALHEKLEDVLDVLLGERV